MTQKQKKRKDVTTIQVNVNTRSRLDKLGDIHNETYDDIINRIIDGYEKGKEVKKK